MQEESGQTHPEIALIRFPSTVRYAVSGMAYLARQPEGKYCREDEVAQAQMLPKNFLAKIFQRLARKGLLHSQRGPRGGYSLARPAEQISLAEIVDASQELAPVSADCLFGLKTWSLGCPCSIHESVIEADRILKERLEKTTLAQISGKEGISSF